MYASAEAKQNMVSLDVLRFLGFYNLSYTRALTPAISVTAQIETPSNFLIGSIIQETGIGARLEGRYNFSQKNLLGIYVAPVIGFNSSTFRAGSSITGSTGMSASDFSATVSWLALGGMVGWQFGVSPNLPELVLGAGVGVEYNIVNASATTGTAPAGSSVPAGNVTLPRLRFTIGYAF